MPTGTGHPLAALVLCGPTSVQAKAEQAIAPDEQEPWFVAVSRG